MAVTVTLALACAPAAGAAEKVPGTATAAASRNGEKVPGTAPAAAPGKVPGTLPGTFPDTLPGTLQTVVSNRFVASTSPPVRPARQPGVAAEEAGAAAAPGSSDELRQRVRRILEEPGYQTEMPQLGELPLSSVPSLGPLAELLLRILLIAAAAALVALLVYVAVDFVRSRRPAPEALPAPAPSRPPRPLEALPAPAPLPDPELLAREGRFGDAVHALLLHALAAVARRRRTPVPASWTSREVLRDLDLPAEPRGALGELVAAVERYLFAGLPLGADDWERCRGAYRRLAGGEGAA